METNGVMEMTRSPSYEFTVDAADHKSIDILRRYARATNVLRSGTDDDRRIRVCVRPRLGRNNPNAHLYAVGGPLHRLSSQDIRPEHGTRFDVYLYEVIDWTKRLAREASKKVG